VSQHVLNALKEERSRYPALITPAQAVALLNTVAWRFRAEGYGLLRAPDAGNGAPNAVGTRARCDVLVNKGNGHHYDVLRDAPDSNHTPNTGAAVPHWLDNGPVDLTRFVEPTPGDESVTPTVVVPEPAVTNRPDLSPLLKRLDQLEQQAADQRRRIEEQRGLIESLHQRLSAIESRPWPYPAYRGTVGGTISIRCTPEPLSSHGDVTVE
jgi:hypothetical protein